MVLVHAGFGRSVHTHLADARGPVRRPEARAWRPAAEVRWASDFDQTDAGIVLPPLPNDMHQQLPDKKALAHGYRYGRAVGDAPAIAMHALRQLVAAGSAGVRRMQRGTASLHRNAGPATPAPRCRGHMAFSSSSLGCRPFLL
ncbi:hypothetical protein [Xanthomonas codiaei]|uniref:Uncharacterized protein n=1 Tax=Xanthomonas codiaei TaxID=56463 RepID=A0A2S7CN06_9XANT|nr:hypothetical protein [Xanthomonas codiaei]PPU62964.1 hypothetical protein XcodCFBP4690_13000 [Xanthomonas codiaei]